MTKGPDWKMNELDLFTSIYMPIFTFSVSLCLSLSLSHTHTHTHIYIYIVSGIFSQNISLI